MKQFSIHILTLSFLLLPTITLAATLDNPLAVGTLPDFFALLLGLVAQIAFPILVLFIVYIGFRFVQHSATGNAEELKKDREYFMWALVGALLVLGAQALSYAIQATVEQLAA